MITWDRFEDLVRRLLARDVSPSANPEQHDAVSAPPNQSLFIVAGPGSGKTTAITLRVLKLIFVDDIEPASILVTTFTRKAAAELSSRILGWGDTLKSELLRNPESERFRVGLERLNLNTIIIGTLDSIAQALLTDFRPAGSAAPVVVDDFVVTALMTTHGLFSNGRFRNRQLIAYIKRLNESRSDPRVSDLSNSLKDLRERILQLQVEQVRFRATVHDPGAGVAFDAVTDLNVELQNRLLYDFARLEGELLERLGHASLAPFLSQLRFVLVDEFQDTNLLQEQIYFSLARAAVSQGGSVGVVGDDDQSLYRFRGATVDLFGQFPARATAALGNRPQLVYLSRNYRSTQEIVDFCNHFVTLDRQFQPARIAGKPPITSARLGPSTHYPVLGMFRPNVATLAHDLAEFLHAVVRGPGIAVPVAGQGPLTIRCNSAGGSAADVVFLASSPREYDSADPPNPRLPLLLREELARKSPPIAVFNPRGRSLVDVPEVGLLSGLILECIDPRTRVQRTLRIPSTIASTIDRWRQSARSFVRTNPPPNRTRTLASFVSHWARRQPLGRRGRWAREVVVNDLAYKLATWIPSLQSDVEGLVFLEVITRAIEEESLIGRFRGQLICDPSNQSLSDASIKELLWQVFVPLASGAIDIDEDLLETVPADRLNVMSVHQAKGLEFPLVVVDVGSDFRRVHPLHAFKRFPQSPGGTCNWEDELRPASPLGPPSRSGRDRAFDDLVRHYFVAFSRPQDVLMLVGLDSVRTHYQTASGPRSIECVSTGWDRSGRWHWGRGLPNLQHI